MTGPFKTEADEHNMILVLAINIAVRHQDLWALRALANMPSCKRMAAGDDPGAEMATALIKKYGNRKEQQ